ncbi:MAG TPA: hypothetical protein VEH77_14930 [Roseiarcus sp.]|nr:hypothetical protein [Roseiarcus sp.]
MNKLSRNRVDHVVVELSARGRGRSTDALVCRWRRDASTGALICAWGRAGLAREPASPVPLRRAS